jgi:hypothetical protein
MDYFKLAVELTRAEAAPTLAKLAMKYRAIQRIAFRDEQTLDEINAEERDLFDRAEARAINSGAW